MSKVQEVQKIVRAAKVAVPVLERAVLTATAINSTVEYKHKEKVSKGLVRASVVLRVLRGFL